MVKMPRQKEKVDHTDEAMEIMLRLNGTRDLSDSETRKVMSNQCPACGIIPMKLEGAPFRGEDRGFNILCVACKQVFNLRPGHLTQIWSWKYG